MRFFSVKPKFKTRTEKKEAEAELTSLDRAIIKKSEGSRGEDLMGIISACKPYKSANGDLKFTTTDIILSHIKKLTKQGYLNRR